MVLKTTQGYCPSCEGHVFSMLIDQVWPKTGYDQTNTLAGSISLIIMHAGIVIFKLAALLIFAFFALVTIFVLYAVLLEILFSIAG